MKTKLMVLFTLVLTATAVAAFDGPGVVNDETGIRFVERVSDSRLEVADSSGGAPDYSRSGPYEPNPYDQADILWSVEEWHGSYGAICEDIDVSGNGDYVLCSWNLNYEKWELYESAGSGTPVWTYDLLDGGMYVGSDVSGDISSDGSIVAGCVAGWRDASGYYKGTLFKFNSSSSTPDWTYDFPYVSTDFNSSSKARDVRVTPDGSTIVCLVANVTDDPTKPHQLYIFDSSTSTPTLVIDLPNTDESPSGLDITDDASLMVYSTYDNVYVYDDTGSQVNAFSIDHGWQYAPAIAPDGDWMVYGNYHGHLRLNEWGGSSYSQSWQYTIPPIGYYPWVCGVDVVGDTVMMGSYQYTGSASTGYAYLFDTSSSTPMISDDFGDLTRSVALNNDDGTVGIAASWGPLAGTGWRSAIFMTDSATPYFALDQSYPGSHFACELSADGIIAATGGKRVHAREMGSGGWIYCIESTEVVYDDGEDGPAAPYTFALHPAYPNPARDAVTFSFALPQTGPVTLGLFDIKGRKVETAINETLSAGEHEVSIATGNLAAGVYLYRLTAGEDSAVNKMVVR